MLKTLIVEDELLARKAIQELLEEYCPDVEIEAIASDIDEAKQLIEAIAPDLVMLDVQVGERTSFELLQELAPFSFEVIFITAYAEYAVKAFRMSAVDYLLKPLDIGDLQAAIEKVKQKKALSKADKLETNSEQLQGLLQNFSHPIDPERQKMAITTQNGIKMLTIGEIIRCEGSNGYTIFYLENGNQLVSSQHMAPFEDLLLPYQFFRIHTSHLVNRAFIDEYVNADGGTVKLEDGTRLPVSSRRKKDFLDWLKTI